MGSTPARAPGSAPVRVLVVEDQKRLASGLKHGLEAEGFAKIVVDKKTDVILGVHIVGPEATELIAEGTLAIEMAARVEDIAATIHAHPTLPEAVMEAAEAVHGMAIHAVS